jgi:hypothetical protein
MRTEVITGEIYSLYTTNIKNTNFPNQSTLDRVVALRFCCDHGGPYGRDVETGLTDRVVHHGHLGQIPYISRKFNLQDPWFVYPTLLSVQVSEDMD